jgi:hypothetical protein
MVHDGSVLLACVCRVLWNLLVHKENISEGKKTIKKQGERL